MVQANRTSTDVIDCACVIHGSAYDWIYVEHLYNMLNRGLQNRARLHVYTEASRFVPEHMVKHVLEEWPGIAGPRVSWWYKLQLFNAEHHQGDLLYLDLDTVITRDITWITEMPTVKMWTIRDFRRLQQPGFLGMNSSVMWWNVGRFDWVWQEFKSVNKSKIRISYPRGDQQYLTEKLGINQIRFLDEERIQSWRWQAWDGGFNFKSRKQKQPGTGTALDDHTSILVFHGQPKPHEMLEDVVIAQHWR